MRRKQSQAATPPSLKGHRGVERYLSFLFVVMVIVWNAAIVFIAMEYLQYTGGFDQMAGFSLAGLWLSVLMS